MGNLSHLEPSKVYDYFEQISRIPRGSGHTRQISDWLAAFARSHHLFWRQDEAGNVLIRKPASAGRKDRDELILQGHMDMVAVREPGCPTDPEKDPLVLREDGMYLWAEGTSLGGDDGIAVAYILAILDAEDLEHPPLTALFTVDEEVGMLGAQALDLSDVSARQMINLDSEEEGTLLTGCAGGGTVECRFPAARESVSGMQAELVISGLTGGHSGEEIHTGRANAIALLGRYFLEFPGEIRWRILTVSGGEKDNAIATDSRVQLLFPEADEAIQKQVEAYTGWFRRTIGQEYHQTDPNLKVSFCWSGVEQKPALTAEDSRALSLALMHLPCGVQRRMPGMEEMIETSLNPGILALDAEGKDGTGEYVITYCVRSARESCKQALIARMRSLTECLGGRLRINGLYPAWEYREESPLRACMTEAYQEYYGREPVTKTIHAGLECGIFAGKIEGLDCVSIGPDILDIHTTRERMSIASVRRVWEYLLLVLKKL
ncbi:MAG: beta-Ala-His dipeptidase [Lachnospiraceae bacterium]|jgi:dipeptidase D|nr:beta-Ala-His dipeptidase [Lachnospiraceae bacterium]MCI1656567.1 beta-Ala-His dipeptidase [Lachnospiraceae bacterium]MCI2195049.1 beta-Ala-His dipeptidase [Lachnospiraceae bacterium]